MRKNAQDHFFYALTYAVSAQRKLAYAMQRAYYYIINAARGAPNGLSM